MAFAPAKITAPFEFLHVTTPVYVGDLHPDVIDVNLFELFSTIGPVESVRVCRDYYTGSSRGYGYVNFFSQKDATIAIEKLNHRILCGMPIRVMKSRYDPDSRNSGIGNVFVKNLSGSIDAIKIREMFSKFGAISSCKVAIEDGKSKGYGFVQFDSQDSANAAIENLNGITVDGKKIYVGVFIKKSDRVTPNPELKYTNLYIKNLDQDITEELIELKFSEFGRIMNAVVEKDGDGNSKGFGFVNFVSPESARLAVEAMNGLQLGSKKLYVARAQKKAERREILRLEFEGRRMEEQRKNASNLYVKNINDSVDDNALWEHFSLCGTITSAKVMRGDGGISKGFGFVCFSTQEEAARALNTLHGYMFHGKPLYVAIAQRKEERRAHLLQQLSERTARLAATAADVVPAAYSPIFYGPSGFMADIPATDGLLYRSFGSRSQWRPGGFLPPSNPWLQQMPFSLLPNAFGHQRPNRAPMNAQFLPHLQQLTYSLNSLMGLNGRQSHGDMNSLSPAHPVPWNPQEMGMFSSKLAAATPRQQKHILRQLLFPMVCRLKGDMAMASKITGMLLEMDSSEVLLLLESPEALAAKVEEAVHVLSISGATVGGGQDDVSSAQFLSSEIPIN